MGGYKPRIENNLRSQHDIFTGPASEQIITTGFFRGPIFVRSHMRLRTSALLSCLASIPFAALLTGCSMTETASSPLSSGMVIKGNVHGGQQPVVGSHVYLMAANTTAYGAPSTSLLVASSTGFSDTVGAYVPTASDGSFTITGDYTCTSGTQVYLYALGGNPGAGVNSAAGFLAALGSCPSNGSFASTVPFIYMNEVSTVAAAYGISGFAVDATHVSSSGTATALTDIANAFLNPGNIESIATGTALTLTPAGNGVVPQTTINALANILASCVNSTGPTSTACTTLLADAKSNGSTGNTPTDTATAAINIAHNPGVNVAPLYGLIAAPAPFSPSLSTQPNDFLVGVTYGGVNGTGTSNGAFSIAIDAHGDAWFTNVNNNSVSKFSSTGAPESPAAGFTTASQGIPAGIAIDLNEDAWVVDSASNNLTEFATSGAVLSPAGGYTGGGLSVPQAISVDGTGSVWAVNFHTNSLSKFTSSGTALSTSAGFTGGQINSPTSLAIDAREIVWVANQNPTPGSLSEFSAAGAPITIAAPYTGGGLNNPQAVAIDASNNVWVASYGNTLSEFNSAGTALSPSGGFTGGGLNRPHAVAIDGGGNVWVANFASSTVSEFNNGGLPISLTTGFGPGLFNGPQAIEIDGAGNVWVANVNSTATNAAVTELIGAAVPRVTPLSIAIQQGTLGSRP